MICLICHKAFKRGDFVWQFHCKYYCKVHFHCLCPESVLPCNVCRGDMFKLRGKAYVFE